MSDFKLKRDNLPTLAYTWEKGEKNLAVLYLHGWTAQRKSKKGEALKLAAHKMGCHYISLDYTAHGESEGSPDLFTIEQGFHDVLDVLSTIPEIPLIIVGNSIGGWFSFLVAEQLQSRVKAVLGLAPAVDITLDVWTYMVPDFAKKALEQGDIIGPSEDTQGFCLTKKLFETGEKLAMLTRGISYAGPVRLVWGDRDNRVHLKRILKIKSALKSNDVMVTMIKNADHHLSQETDLTTISCILKDLIHKSLSLKTKGNEI